MLPTPCNPGLIFLACLANSDVFLSLLVAAEDCHCLSSGNLVSLLPRMLDANLCIYKPNKDRSYNLTQDNKRVSYLNVICLDFM